ncbi:MAG: tRNA (guanosine(46)-N7)-methyltransferase TrmB [Spirochaetota bacterium]
MRDQTANRDVSHSHSSRIAFGEARSVRSFVFRRARLNRLHRSAIERLSDTYVLDLSGADDTHGAAEFSLFDQFQRPCARKVFEIGFGMGYATAYYAEQHRDTCVLGSEVYPPGVGKLLSEIERRKLSGVRIVRRDAIEVLERGLRESEIDAVHVFFPDPWPKKKHHKRRLVQTTFLNLVAFCLKPGGFLYITTDWDDYAEHIAKKLDEHENYTNVEPAQRDPRKSVPRTWRPRTAFESKGLSKGHTVSEFYYQFQK